MSVPSAAGTMMGAAHAGMALRAWLGLASLLVGCTASDRPIGPNPIPDPDPDPEPCTLPWRPIFSGNGAPTWSPDGRRIAFFGSRDSSGGLAPGIYVVDTAGSPRQKLMDSRSSWFPPADLAWSPDGRSIAFVFEGQIWTVDVRDRSLLQLTSGSLVHRFPTWDHDSRHLFHITGGRGLRVLDLADGSVSTVVHSDSLATWPNTPARISPDGRRLTFAVARTETTGQRPNLDIRTFREIFVMERDGSNYRRITWFRDHSMYPQWWIDSRRIFFDRAAYECGSDKNGRTTWVINEDGSGLQKWRANLGDNSVTFGFPFALSPDGQRVAFIGKDSTGTMGVLHIRNIDGTRRKQLTSF